MIRATIATLFAALLAQTFTAPTPAPVNCTSGVMQYTASTQVFSCGVADALPLPISRKSGWFFTESFGTAMRTVGVPTPVTSGTLAAVSQTNSYYVSYTNTTTLGNVARINYQITELPFRTRWNPTIEMDIFTDATNLTNVMYAFGIYGGNTPPVSATGTNADYAMFRFINGTDANWKVITNDGTIAHQITTDVTTAIAPATRYRLKLVFSGAGTSLQPYINGVAAGSAITSALPTVTNDVGVWLEVVNTVGGASTNRAFSVARVYHEVD